MTQWACVGCQPPHWENGVYVNQLTIHQDCRRHGGESQQRLENTK